MSSKRSMSQSRGSARKRSTTNNARSRANNHNGFVTACRNLRGVVHDEVGYPLLCYMNDKNWSNAFPEFEVGNGGEEEIAFQNADSLLKDAYTGWVKASIDALAKKDIAATAAPTAAAAAAAAAEGLAAKEESSEQPFHEKNLTKALAKKMGCSLLSPPDKAWKSISEHRVHMENPRMTGSIDVLVQDGDGSPILIVEAGLLNDDWWKKLDQGLMYVKGLENFTKPLLYVVLTVERIKDIDAIKKDHTKIIEGRIGTFLVTPRSDRNDGYRMSLLTRVETSDLAILSAHVGRVLGAACLLPRWHATTSKSRYLGPSCRSFTDNEGKKWVLRVYDNRLVHTDRRPDLYLDEAMGEGGEKVCTISDTDNPDDALSFGRRIEAVSCSDGWLWAKKGQFLAIKVPFRSGRHYAKNIKDFIPILKHLKKLHEHNCVHGDIRGFNMLMDDEDKGYLIDLDYGGYLQGDDHNEVPRYPEGYIFVLPDGLRPKPVKRRPDLQAMALEPVERSPISMRDDLQAMASLMFVLYKPEFSLMSVEMKSRLVDLQIDQEALNKRISTLAVENKEASTTLIDELLNFAAEAGWDVTPNSVALLDALKEFGYDVNVSEEGPVVQGGTGIEESIEQARVGTDPATGSPSKQKTMG